MDRTDVTSPANEIGRSTPGELRLIFRWAGGIAAMVVVGTVGAVAILGPRFDRARFERCETAMSELVRQQAVSAHVAATLVTAPTAEFTADQGASLVDLARQWNQHTDRIGKLGATHARARVYPVRDMVHFAFFDPSDRLREFVCVSN
jgi:hypothetical protein